MQEETARVQSNRLRGLLTEKRITHSAMAQAISISSNAFSMKINGYRAWQVEEILIITKVLGYKDPKKVFPELFDAYGLMDKKEWQR
jgi:plasmid maintenance system antidote protein VapI